jgi:hypothetical protein
MAGPEIHANAIDTLLRGLPLHDTGSLADLLIAIGLALLPALLGLRLRPFAALGLGAGAAVAYVVVAQIAFGRGLILPVTVPLIGLAVALVGALLVHWVTASVNQKARAFQVLRTAFREQARPESSRSCSGDRRADSCSMTRARTEAGQRLLGVIKMRLERRLHVDQHLLELRILRVRNQHVVDRREHLLVIRDFVFQIRAIESRDRRRAKLSLLGIGGILQAMALVTKLGVKSKPNATANSIDIANGKIALDRSKTPAVGDFANLMRRSADR